MNTENLSIPEGYTLYEQLDTGYVITKDNCRVFIPYDYNGDTGTSIYRPGSGSLGDDYYHIKESLNEVGDQIVVMISGTSADDNGAQNYTYNEQNQKLYGIANEVQQSLGITTSGITENGYSMSYDAAMKGGAEYAIANPDAEPITINLIDGHRGTGDKGLEHILDLNQTQLEALAENGATVNIFERSNEMDNSSINEAANFLSEHGINVNVYYGENNHAEQRNDAMEARILTSTPDYSGYKEVTYSASNTSETTNTNPGASSSIPPVNNGTQNIDLSKYATQVGETATKYVIPAGEMGNDTGKTIELIIPNDKNGIYGMYGQIDGGGKETWSKMEDSLLNNNEGAIAVKLSPASSITSSSGRAQTAEENMEILSYIGKITGQKEAQVIGASNGSLYALDVGAESTSSPNKYGVTVTSVGWTDYANPENADFITALEKMKKGNVELIGITDTDISENSGTGKAIAEYYKRGGTASIYQYATGYSHNTKCYMGALAFMGIATGVNFSQYLKYENGEQKISPYDSSTIKTTSSSGSSETVSVDYQFVRDNLNMIFALINNSTIKMSDSIGIATSGSKTYQAANAVFNNYANTSIDFLNSLGQTCGNILAMTESILELDGALAAAALNDINSINISSFNEFYDKLPNFDMLSSFKDEGGTLKITKDGLLAAMSDSNVLLSTLTNDITDTQKLKSQLDSFVQDSSNNLKGPAWDKMRSKVNEYSETCQKKINYANNLITSMKNAYQKLLDHMEEFDTLDMAQIGEIEQGISNMKAQISALESLIASTPDYEDIMGYDHKTGTYTVVGQISHVAEKESWRETIKICEEVKAVLEKNLQKLNELPSVDSSAAEEITSNTTNQPETPTAKPISKPTSTPNDSVSLDTNDLDNPKPNQTVNNESTNVNKDNNKESIDKQDETKNDQIVEKNENNTNTQDEKQTSTQNNQSIPATNEQQPTINNTSPETNSNNTNPSDSSKNNTSNNQNTTIPSEQQSTINNQATTDNLNSNYDNNNNSNIFKTFGIAGGIAGAVGAAAYGAKIYKEKKNENNYEQIKEKNNNQDEEDDETGLDNFE